MKDQISIDINEENSSEQKKPERICVRHFYAKEEDLIDVIIKKTGEVVKRCRHCERARMDSKKLSHQEWQEHKENVTEYYARRVLAMGKNSLKMHEYPDELVQAKQAVIMLKREYKKAAEPLKKCATHGALYIEDVIKSGKTRTGGIHYKCRRCMKAFHDRHYALNKAKVLAAHKKYKRDNPEKAKEIHKRSWEKHKHKYLKKENDRRRRFKELNPEKYREYNKIDVTELRDGYVKKLITKRSNLKVADIPQSLVETMRAVQQLKRTIRAKKQGDKLISLEEKINDENQEY